MVPPLVTFVLQLLRLTGCQTRTKLLAISPTMPLPDLISGPLTITSFSAVIVRPFL
jgi:hypothetical protein